MNNDFLDIDILNMNQTINGKVEDYITRVLNKCLENKMDNEQLKISYFNERYEETIGCHCDAIQAKISR